MSRWDKFRIWLRNHNRECVRVLERGDGGAFHFHCVTPQWWDATELRTAAEKYGFGRVNAKAIPVASAIYVAKYVGKASGRKWLPRGMRQWACYGFKGVSAKNIRRTEKVVALIPDEPRDKLYDVLVWKVGDNEAFRHRLRPPHDGPDVIRTMQLKPAQSKLVLEKLTSGAICSVGEFRASHIRTIKMDDHATKEKVDRVIVENHVELGGAATVVTTWTKPGTKPEEVKAPQVNRGEPVLVLIESVKFYKGSKQVAGSVEALPALNV